MQRQTAVAISLGLFSIVPLTGNGSQTDRTYRIATVAWAGWSPLQAAEVKGFWTELGIKVQPVTYNDPTLVLEAVRDNRVDFAMDMVGSIASLYMNGEPAVIIAETNWSHGGDKIIVKNQHRIAEYKGAPLGVFLYHPSCLYFLDRYLSTQGLALTDFRIVEIGAGDLAEQFIAGRIPAILNYEPHAGKALAKGDGQILATSADFEGCVPECIWTNGEHSKSIEEEDIAKILQGWIKAAAWVQDDENWEEYQKILNERTFSGMPAFSGSELRSFIRAVKIHTPRKMMERNEDGGGLSRYLISLRSFLQRNGMLKKDFEPADLFDNHIVTTVLQRELERMPSQPVE